VSPPANWAGVTDVIVGCGAPTTRSRTALPGRPSTHASTAAVSPTTCGSAKPSAIPVRVVIPVESRNVAAGLPPPAGDTRRYRTVTPNAGSPAASVTSTRSGAPYRSPTAPVTTSAPGGIATE
jgi:hypothetical protein